MENEPRIVEGVAVMAASRDKWIAPLIEEAGRQAVQRALDEGVSLDNSDEIRNRILAAQQEVRDKIRSGEIQPPPAE